MQYRLLTDDDVQRHLTMSDAVACMEEAFRLHAAGTLQAPARVAADLNDAGNMIFTVGGTQGDNPLAGFRVYDLKHLGGPNRDELVAVFCGRTSALLGLVAGKRLGPIRTGAIGGVAIKYLSNPNAKTLGIIGTGPQAATQLEAAVAVRDFKTINVFSRNADNRQQFAERMSDKLDREINAVDSAQAAVEGSDVVITATVSSTPVLQADWLQKGVHINNIGPKFKDQTELDADVIARTDRFITDTRAQVDKTGDRFILHGTPQADRLEELSPIVAGTAPGRREPSETTLFYSLGLAGTEMLLAQRLLEITAD